MRFSIAKWYPAHSSNYTAGRGGNPVRQITIHHTAANNTTLRYLYANAARNGSAHFFVSSTVIEQYVDTDNTAWTNSYFPSNQVSITIEVNGDWRNGYHNQTTLNNLQKLLVELRRKYPTAQLTYHMDEAAKAGKTTLCPADLKHKGYAKTVWDKVTAILYPPAPTPVPSITYAKITPKKVMLIRNANLWNFNFTSWDKAQSIGAYPAGHVIDVVAQATNALGGKYYMTAYSYNDGAIRATNGFNVADCKNYVAPAPEPQPIPSTEPEPESPPIPEPDRNAIIAFLTLLRNLITEFLGKFKN